VVTTDQVGRWLAVVVCAAIGIVVVCGALALGFWLIGLAI